MMHFSLSLSHFASSINFTLVVFVVRLSRCLNLDVWLCVFAMVQ
jgi:hypothetical protein